MKNEINPAGFWVRFFASILDNLIVFLPLSILVYFITDHIPYYSEEFWSWNLLYYVYLVAIPLMWSGYVIGKKIMGIKIKRMDGEKLTLFNMVLREIVSLFLLSYITFGVSMIVSVFLVIFREDKRGIHDLIAGTRVVHVN
ncbi:RDD family protein [Jeotgalibacillus proteolyticus]|uniref:RDD family protein n=1 Tax=Jeotgalibacillus proteolyticus TaxID=2082395 RepID=A0A2S5GBQ1_9BACL|nr:RDD family protein [Jeotgalibacillus proteolyticus]PPA70426.1 RDD family protein [Jeotgalibacillus proteolyticus]